MVINRNSPIVLSLLSFTLFSILSNVPINFLLIVNKSPCFLIAMSKFFKDAFTPSTFSAKTTKASLLVSVILLSLLEDCINRNALMTITTKPETIEETNTTVVYL